MNYITVRNLRGAAGAPGKERLTWWKARQGLDGSTEQTCVRFGCLETATVGAPVIKAHGEDPQYYIVPLCFACSRRAVSFLVPPTVLEQEE